MTILRPTQSFRASVARLRTAIGNARPDRPRRSLFIKYFISLFIVVAVPVFAGGASEAWIGYRDQRARLNDLLRAEARLASERIQDFIDGIGGELGWTVQTVWDGGGEVQHRDDALRLLRQAPAVASISLVDGAGIERVFVSRLGFNRTGAGADLSQDPAIEGARTAKIWYGPVTFERGSEPYMTLSVAGNRREAGIAVAKINLKAIWDVISRIKIGETGHALVLDGPGRLIAHPDLSLVLRGDTQGATFGTLKSDVAAADRETTITNAEGHPVVALMSPVRGVDWTVVVEQPLSEAFAPLRAALWRVAALIVAGAVLALALAYGLARSMAKPIRELERGVERIGAGEFAHRISIATGDELEQLAMRFNEMANELTVSKEKSERIERLKRFLAPQVAELIESSGNDSLLEGQRRDVVVIFADLRGFTSFSARADPEVIMDVLAEYYEALGDIIIRYGATLTSFAGDGLMLLLNAPMPCAEPAIAAIQLSIDMQIAVQALIGAWRARGHVIGFGVGLAQGPATVGRIGFRGRFEYTAIGNVVNLASRLCATATDRQILIDGVTAAAADGRVVLTALGPRPLKGYDDKIPVFSVVLQETVMPAPLNL